MSNRTRITLMKRIVADKKKLVIESQYKLTCFTKSLTFIFRSPESIRDEDRKAGGKINCIPL